VFCYAAQTYIYCVLSVDSIPYIGEPHSWNVRTEYNGVYPIILLIYTNDLLIRYIGAHCNIQGRVSYESVLLRHVRVCVGTFLYQTKY